MKNAVNNFLDLLTTDQVDKLASVIAEIEEEEKYASLAKEMDMTVEQIKTSELLTDLVNEGFMDGLDELASVTDWNEWISGAKTDE